MASSTARGAGATTVGGFEVREVRAEEIPKPRAGVFGRSKYGDLVERALELSVGGALEVPFASQQEAQVVSSTIRSWLRRHDRPLVVVARGSSVYLIRGAA